MIVIPDIFQEIVEGLDLINVDGVDSVNFYYGNPIEINNNLVNLDMMREAKYPAIFLFLDLDEIRDSPGYWAKINPTLAIVNSTRIEYNASERLENNFRTILHPIYMSLIEAINTSPSTGLLFIDHVKRDHYFYGSSLNNNSEFNDNLDAITVNIRDLIINKICK